MNNNSLLALARQYRDQYGYSVIPIRADGSKSPVLWSWRDFITRQPTDDELARMFTVSTFRPPMGIAIVQGAVSGNASVLDFDDKNRLDLWEAFLDRALVAIRRLTGAPIVETPKPGRHLYIRSEAPPPGSTKLAMRRNPDPESKQKWLVRFETKGEGGYVVGVGSPLEVHTTGRPYKLISGSFDTIPILTTAEHDQLMTIARSFDERPAGEQGENQNQWRQSPLKGHRPGDRFNARADWNKLLTRYGWRLVRTSPDGVQFWARPEKLSGYSATIGYKGINRLYVFSTDAFPFEAGRSYSAFEAWALLEYDGDFKAAVATLRRLK